MGALQDAFNDARQKGLVITQKDFAELVGITPAAMSNALAGKGTFNADNIAIRARRAIAKAEGGSVQAVGNMGTTNVGIPPKKFENEKEWFALVAEKDKQIDRLLAIIERMHV